MTRAMPLYYEISNRLIDVIKQNDLKPGDHMPATSLWVKTLGVNYRTIKSAYEVLQTKGIIQQKANRPALVVKILQTKHKLMFVRWDGSALNFAIAAGIKKFTDRKNCGYVVIDAQQNHDYYKNAILHPGQHVDGLIVMPFEDEEYVKVLKNSVEMGRKIVFVDRIAEGVEVSSVTADNFAGGYMATSHLIETHNCPVYFMGNTVCPSSCRERAKGWQEAMIEHHFQAHEQYIYELPGSEMELVTSRNYGLEEDRKVALKIFRDHKKGPCCIFAVNDYVARGVYLAAEEVNLQIGRDVFVVGFDNLSLCDRMPIPLSSINYDTQRIGYEAAKLLYDSFSHEVNHLMHNVLPVELKVRTSSVGIATDKEPVMSDELCQKSA